MNLSDLSATPRKARVEIIPLIDVVFFLLATFVLFTLSLERIGALLAQLPQSGPPPQVDTTVRLQAIENGLVVWKEGDFGPPETLSLGELTQRLTAYHQANPSVHVMISGNNRVTFGASVRLLDTVRACKIKEVAIQTDGRGADL